MKSFALLVDVADTVTGVLNGEWPCDFDWLIEMRLGSRHYRPDAPRSYMTGSMCPISVYGGPVVLLNFRMPPRLFFVMSSGSKKKEPRYICLCDDRATRSQGTWAEVSTSVPHLHSGLSDSPIRWRYGPDILCPVRRPVTALDCVLLTL